LIRLAKGSWKNGILKGEKASCTSTNQQFRRPS